MFALIALGIGVTMEQINEETIMVSERHPQVEAAGRQKNASSQYRANSKEDRRCDAAEGF